MVTRILRSTVGSGKTEAALQRLSSVVNDPQKPFARVWVLLASGRQQAAFRERLTHLPDARSVYFNTEIFDFSKLNDRLLKIVHQPQPNINDAARLSFLRAILQRLKDEGQLRVFDSIADKVGFAQLIANLIDEFKQNLIDPDVFTRYAQTAKDEDIALIYRTYQNMLIEHQLVDREGEAWLALNALRESPTLAHDVDLVIVDGFDQFSVVQSQILTALSSHVGELIITLTSMGAGAEKQQVGGRFQQALNRLQEAHSLNNVDIIIEDITAVSDRHPDLQTLNQALFNLQIVGQQPISHDHIRFFEAPEPVAEVGLILRDVKHQLLAGAKPDDILIALRDWQRYQSQFFVLGRLYDLPLLMHYDDSIANNPAIDILMKALSLSGGPYGTAQAHKGFSRRDVLDILRSPYVRVEGLDTDAVQFLDDMSQAYQIISGYEAWFDAIDDLLTVQSDHSYDDDHEKFVPNIIATSEFLSDLSVSLEAFFEIVTPPQNASLMTYIAHIERLIGVDIVDGDDPDDAEPFDYPSQQIISLNMPSCIRETSHDPALHHLITRDINALNAFKDILRGYVANYEILSYVWGLDDATLHWTYLLNDLHESIVANQNSLGNIPRSGRILVTTATNARGLPHDHVYIAGMAEGVFPALRKEDPLYLDSERKALREASHGAIWLPTQAEQTDDAGLFYELISLARQTLTLSRPTVQGSKLWNESYLWRLTHETFADNTLETIRLGIGELPAPDQVASLDEAFLSVANHLPTAGNDFDPDTAQLLQWLLSQDATQNQWTFITQSSQTETGRLSRQPFDRYTGVIQQDDLRADLQNELDETYRWSASRLNDFGACAYKFFASRILKLESIAEPEEGFDNLQYGSLIHKILERIYHEIAQEGVLIQPDYLDLALEIASDILNTTLQNAPLEYGVRESPQWRYEQNAIRRLVKQSLTYDFSDDAPLNQRHGRTVFANELRFTVPIRIKGWAQPLLLNGSIDRVDRVGDQLFVIDYKTGSAPGKSDLGKGRNFQMFVYLRALEVYVATHMNEKLRVGGGYFWALRDTNTPALWQNVASVGEPFMDDDGYFELAENKLVEYLGALQAGNFSVAPPTIASNGRCIAYCEFYQLCRLANINRYKSGQRNTMNADDTDTMRDMS